MMNTLLFPNPHHTDNRLRSGEIKVVGGRGELEIEAPYGKDVITVIASETQFSDLPDVLSPGADSYYSQITTAPHDAVTLRSKGLRLNKTASPSSVSGSQYIQPDVIATDTCFIVSRPE